MPIGVALRLVLESRGLSPPPEQSTTPHNQQSNFIVCAYATAGNTHRVSNQVGTNRVKTQGFIARDALALLAMGLKLILPLE
jgi:hypothetical protein